MCVIYKILSEHVQVNFIQKNCSDLKIFSEYTNYIQTIKKSLHVQVTIKTSPCSVDTKDLLENNLLFIEVRSITLKKKCYQHFALFSIEKAH